MKVRDLTFKKTEYKGRLTEARDAMCPCRPCFNAHDCGYIRYHDSKQMISMHCATRYNRGCPLNNDTPEHIFTSNRARKCKRCGTLRSLVGRRLEKINGTISRNNNNV